MRPVIWSSAARRDYLDILRYVSEDNPAAAERICNAIEQAGAALGEFATGRPGRVTGIYEKALPGLPWLIAYSLQARPGGESVVILRVIHAARDWPEESWPE
jgi:toxin ParE1/3/4